MRHEAPVLESRCVDGLKTAADVARLAGAMFGDAVAGAGQGAGLHVVHVASVHDPRRAEADWRSIAVGPAAPRSVLDGFALAFTRARARVIVVTGAVLRAEPHLRYELFGPGASAAALHAWRRGAGLDAPPELVVLTRGAELDLDHPALHSWARPWLALPRMAGGASPAARAARDALATAAVARGIGVLTLEPTPGDDPLAATVAAIAARGWAGVVAVEAGPSVTSPAYAAVGQGTACPIDELCLSIFHGEHAPLVDVPWPDPAVLAASLAPAGAAAQAREPSGPWSFRRYVRPARSRDVPARATLSAS